MTDNLVYFEENFEIFSEMLGFPYLRLNPMLLSDEINNLLSTTNEMLLLMMHCNSAELLVVSNKRILLYRIPQPRSKGKIATEFGIFSFVPYGIVLIILLRRLTRQSRDVPRLSFLKRRREEARRVEECLPSIKEACKQVWDISNLEVLAKILCYRNKIILENSFCWKNKLKKIFNNPTEILIGTDGISLFVGNKKEFIGYAKSEWNFIQIAHLLVEQNRKALELIGWTVDISPENIVFRKGELANGSEQL